MRKYIVGILTLAALTLAAAPSHAQDITSGLVGHWTLDETSGTTAVDSGSGGNNGTMTGGLDAGTDSAAGKISTALTFDGTGDYIDTANIDFSAGGYTLSAWAKTSTSATNHRILSKRSSGTNQKWLMIVNTGNAECGLRDGAAAGTSTISNSFSDGTWHHFACIVDNIGITVYADGVAGNTVVHDNTLLTNANNWNIGRNNNSIEYFNGDIDDVRIYNRALSVADISVLALGAGPGSIIYNTNQNVAQYHDGTDWIAMGQERYVPNAVSLDGAADYLSHASPLTGVSDGKQITASFWAKFNSYPSSGCFDIFNNNPSRVRITYCGNGTETMQLTVRDTGGTVISNTGCGPDPHVVDQWYHHMISIDVSDPNNHHCYVDGVASEQVFTAQTDVTLDFTTSNYFVGAGSGPSSLLDGSIADLWIDFGTYIDLSIAANRTKFYNGGPVNLGSDGSGPTGTAPDIFLSGDTVDWHTNDGLGGGFTENGALTDALSKPGGLIYDPLFPRVKLLMNFDDATSGTVTTDTGNTAHTITSFNGAALSNSIQKYGIAASDTQGNNYWEVTGNMDDFSLNAPHTIEFWVRYVGSGPFREFFTFWETAGSNRAEFAWNNTAGGTFYGDWGQWTGIAAPTFTWMHYAITYDGSDTTLYIDGVSQGNPSVAHYLGTSSGIVFDSFNIGTGSDNAGINTALAFSGWLDDFRYTEGVRYAADFTPPLRAMEGGAYCANPTEFIGSLTYNTTSDQMQFCNGVDWIAMGPPGDGGGGCSNPTGTAGALTFNTSFNRMQYCEGDTWIGIGGDGVNAALLSGLIAHWPLDETSGSSIADSSGNGYTGTWVDGTGNDVAEETTTGVIGNAIVFDGVNDIVDLPSNSDLSQNRSIMTASLWVKFNTTGVQEHLFSSSINAGGNSSRYTLEKRDTDVVRVAGRSTDGESLNFVETVMTLSANTWYHLVGILDYANDDVDIYVNGVQVATTGSVSFTNTSTDNTTSGLSVLGQEESGTSRELNGPLDDVRVYDRRLSAAEILALYNQADCPAIGDVCNDGSVYAGELSGTRLYVPPADNSAGIAWNNGATNYTTTSTTSTTDGATNTATLIITDSDSVTGGTQLHDAAQLCADSTAHGKSNWYLPAQDELNVLYTNEAAIGGFTLYYWSSTENPSDDAWHQLFSDGTQSFDVKPNTNRVRCVRK